MNKHNLLDNRQQGNYNQKSFGALTDILENSEILKNNFNLIGGI